MVNRYRFFHLLCGLVLATGGGMRYETAIKRKSCT